AEDGIVCGNYNRIRQIFSVKNNSAARPAPDPIALTRVTRHMSKFSKRTKRQSRGVPTVESDAWERRVLEKGLVNGHVHRRRPRAEIMINIQRGKHRHLASGEPIHLSATQ